MTYLNIFSRYQLLSNRFAKIHFEFNNVPFDFMVQALMAGRYHITRLNLDTHPDRFYYSENFGQSCEIRSHALDKTSCRVNTEVSCSWMQPISRAPSLPWDRTKGKECRSFIGRRCERIVRGTRETGRLIYSAKWISRGGGNDRQRWARLILNL